MICDFCSDPVPDDQEHTVFVSQPISYSVEGTHYMDSVDWAACDECLPLIKAGDREGLIQRAIVKFRKAHPDEWHPGSEFMLRFYLSKFWKYYIPM